LKYLGDLMGTNASIAELLKTANKQSGSRYVIKKGKRIKREDYKYMNPQDKETLEMREGQNWSEIDKELDKLNEEWIKETCPLMREVLDIRYQLKCEYFIKPVKEFEKKHVIKLEKKLKLLLNKLG
jgi:hypothetical protein